MGKILYEVHGPIATVEVEEGQPVQIRIDERWLALFERMNTVIRQKLSFLGIDGSFHTVTGDGSEEEFWLLQEVIRTRSNGQLVLKPKDQEGVQAEKS